ncbi:wd g-beta repeat-containing protein, partial [Cystoisospora suis]
LASASSDLGVRVYDVQQNYEPVRTLQGHEDIVSSIKFCTLGGPSPGDSSPSSVLHASGGLFHRQSSNGVPSSLGASATSSAPGTDSQLYSPLSSLFLVSGSRDGTVKLWNVGAGLCLRTFSSASGGDTLGGVGTREGWIRSVSVPDDDLKAAKVLASCGNDQKVCLWRYDFGVTVREMTGHSHVVEDVVFASAKMLQLLQAHKQAPAPLPSGLVDEALLREKEKASGGELHVLRQAGLVLFSSSRDRTLRMWDATQGTTMKVFVGHDNWVRRVILHPAGRHIISCSDDRSVRCWNVISGACERVLSSAHTQFVTCLGFDCTSYLLATGSLDRSVKLWSCSRSQQAELTEESTAGLNHHKASTPATTTTPAGAGEA